VDLDLLRFLVGFHSIDYSDAETRAPRKAFLQDWILHSIIERENRPIASHRTTRKLSWPLASTDKPILDNWPLTRADELTSEHGQKSNGKILACIRFRYSDLLLQNCGGFEYSRLSIYLRCHQNLDTSITSSIRHYFSI
jgi:hypothetical protein